MSFSSKIASILGIKNIRGPIVIKDIEESTHQLQEMYHLALRTKSVLKKEEIFKEMLFFQLGHDGEKAVMYELKNSYVPMVVLHDIGLKTDEHSAQVDFVVITHEFVMLLETKKLSGDIEITSEGEFVRSYKGYNGKGGYRKEGIYSPVTQNEKHVELVKSMLVNAGLIKQTPVHSIIVIANPKSIIRRTKAPKEISNLIVKVDQLKSKIKNSLGKKNEIPEEAMVNIYKYLLANHSPKEYDLMDKYNVDKSELEENIPYPTMEETASFMKNYKRIVFSDAKIDNDKPVPKELTPVDEKFSIDEINEMNNGSWDLKKYRLLTSKKEGIPPYYIFTDAELELLMVQKPKNINELHEVKGFGPKKIEKYGQDILIIINK